MSLNPVYKGEVDVLSVDHLIGQLESAATLKELETLRKDYLQKIKPGLEQQSDDQNISRIEAALAKAQQLIERKRF